MSYKLRVDLAYASLDNVLSVISKYSNRYAYVVEGDPPNRHIHMWFVSQDNHQTIRKGVKKVVSGKGNAVYSLKECYPADDDIDEYPINYLAYMCKEGLCKFVNIPESIEQSAREYQLAFVQKMRDKAKSKLNIFDSIEQELLSILIEYQDGYVLKYPERNPNGFQNTLTRDYVVDFVLRYVRDHKIMYRHFCVVSWCQTLCLRYVPKQFNEFKQKILYSI